MKNTACLFPPLVGALLALTALPSLASQSPSTLLPQWDHASGTEAYIPSSLTFAAHDNHVLSAANFGSRRLMLFDAPGASSAERGRRVFPTANLGMIEIAAASDGEATFSAAQYATGMGTERFTEFARYEPSENPLGSALTPTWTSNFALPGTVAVRIATDSAGDRLTAVSWDGAEFLVVQIDGRAGNLLGSESFSGTSLTRLEVSDSGDRIALLAGPDLRVYDAQLNLLHSQTFEITPSSFSLAGNGQRYAVGFTNRVDVYGEQGLWSLQQTLDKDPAWLPTQLDLDHDGTALAIGWWNVATGFDVLFELRGGAALELLREHEEVGVGNGLQNLPQAVRITKDGKRAAFGCWGDGDSDPEVILVDRDQPDPVLKLDLPGSVRALDLDQSGTRIAVAFKETHANLVGFRGSVRLYDTGERDLRLVEVPSVADGLKIVHRPLSVPHAAYLALGQRSAFPTPLASGSMLALERTAIRVVAIGSASSETESSLPLARHPNLRGQKLSIQMLFRTRAGLRASESVIDFTLL